MRPPVAEGEPKKDVKPAPEEAKNDPKPAAEDEQKKAAAAQAKSEEQMKELHVILLNLKVVTTHAKALVDSLAEKPNRVIFSGKAANLTPEDEIIKSSKPLPAKKP